MSQEETEAMDGHPQAPGGDGVGQDWPKSVDNLQGHCLQHATKEPEVEPKGKSAITPVWLVKTST